MIFTKEQRVFLALTTVFISLLVVSNVIAVKTVSIGGLIGPAAVICYSLTFAVTDTISEIWGRKTTQFLVLLGLGAAVLSALFIRWAIVMKGSPFWENQEQYELILGSNLRIVIASLLAYIVSQTHDVWAFHFWKRLTNGKYLWLRNNLSSMVSQLLDTVIFIVVAFYGTGAPMWTMIVGQYLIKLGIAALDTPLVYAMVGFIKKRVLKG
ncbi:VUT family protein [Prolixibacteraceae bacterium JC049]|nr:VUT family protein [Prolixibacteraceae bacterium JC049]